MLAPGSRLVRWCLWGLVGLACALQAYEIPNRSIDPDELEHLHAAFCVWNGEVPYRDFFEHHAPALYYLTWPLFQLFGPNLSVLWGARCLMFCCSLTALWLTSRLARRWAGEPAGLLAAVLLAWTSVFQVKGIELRPDVPAMLLLLLAVVVLNDSGREASRRSYIAVGLLCGLALLFTQKSVIPAAGIGAAMCVSRLLNRAPVTESMLTALARVVVPIVAGVAAVWGIASLLFAAAGAADDFWYSTWYQLWIWPIRSSRWEYLRPTLAGDLAVWATAAIEMGFVARQWREAETWKHHRGAIAVVVAVCIASLPFVKATYPQFYLLWMPFLAALAASRIITIFADLEKSDRIIATILMGESLVVIQALLWRRAYSSGTGGALPRLAETDFSNAVVLFGLACAMCAVVVLVWRRQWGFSLLLVSGLGMTYGVLRDVDLSLWSNRKQVEAIESIHRQVPPDGRVLDGFTGYAALRPHAWYYWWINEYSLALVPERERDGELLARLKLNPPAAVLFDRNVELLPGDVVEWLRQHYEPVDPPPLWLKKTES
jgi:hypothetical protein